MKKLKDSMISIAKDKHGDISPCGGHDSFETCFTEYEGDLMLWYNCSQNSTHIIKKLIVAS